MSSIATAGAAFFAGGGASASQATPEKIRAAISNLKGAVEGIELGTEERQADRRPPCLNNFINGEWVKSTSASYLPVRDPSTGLISCQVWRSNAEDADAAVKAAHEGHKIWSKIPALQRAELLERVAAMLRSKAEELALCER